MNDAYPLLPTFLICCSLLIFPHPATRADPPVEKQEPVAKEMVSLEIHLHAPGLGDGETVYITGSLPQLGSWNPGAVAMKSCGKGRWVYCLQCEAIAVVEYKFTLGSWSREGADVRGNPLPNFSVDARHNAKQEHHIAFWTESSQRKVSGQVTGTVRYHEQPATEKLRARKICVWLPPGYDDSEVRFPVLYMHDGQNLFDPATSAFGVDWQIDETCTELIAADEIPPLIVVGIYNTRDRSREYLPGELGEAYQALIIEQIKPTIDREYRTLVQREHTFVGGSSAGGICAFILAWEYPQVFSKALCFSPYFQSTAGSDSQLDYVKTVRQSPKPAQPLTFYLDNGGVGLERLLQPGIDAMLEALDEKGFQRNEDLHWLHAPGDKHSESAWAKRFPDAVKLLFEKK